MQNRQIIRWREDAKAEMWSRTTLDQLGRLEGFLEDRLAESPELLGLESRRTGIQRPFRIFRQLPLQTPSERQIYPDIVLLSSSGHIIVVEVKRFVNPELKDRAVIAQIIDYASSFAALSEEQCVRLFGDDKNKTWTECVTTLFPNEPNPDELAELFYSRIQAGELNLVIACDKVPASLPDIVSGIASQSALGFDLDLVEITPYVAETGESAEVMLVPTTRLATEIVARTSVTVTYRQGDTQPSTEVTTTSLQAVEENIKAASRQHPDARTWTAEEVEAEFRSNGHPVTFRLLDFVKEHGAGDEYIAPGKKQSASFSFYVRAQRNGVETRRAIFNCRITWDSVNLYLNFAESLTSAETVAELRLMLKKAFGNEINTELKEPYVSYDEVAKHIGEFERIMLWFKSEAES